MREIDSSRLQCEVGRPQVQCAHLAVEVVALVRAVGNSHVSGSRFFLLSVRVGPLRRTRTERYVLSFG
jgi:hypothetical protein